MTYLVVVGNVGTVYDGPSVIESYRAFHEYVKISKEGVGRAGGEDVTRFRDGEVINEYIGTLSQQSED